MKCQVHLPSHISPEDVLTLQNTVNSFIYLKEYKSHSDFENIWLQHPIDKTTHFDFVDNWYAVTSGSLGIVMSVNSSVIEVNVPSPGDSCTVKNTGQCHLMKGDLVCGVPGAVNKPIRLPSISRVLYQPIILPEDGATIVLHKTISTAMYNFYETRMPAPIPRHPPAELNRCRYRNVSVAVPGWFGSKDEEVGAFFARLLIRLGFLAVSSHQYFASLLFGDHDNPVNNQEAAPLIRALIDGRGRMVHMPHNARDVITAIQQLPHMLSACNNLSQMTTVTHSGTVIATFDGRPDVSPGEEFVLLVK